MKTVNTLLALTTWPALTTLLILTMFGFSGNTAAVVVDLTLTCDNTAMTCSYEFEATLPVSGPVVEGVFENMQHVETKADATFTNFFQFTASAESTFDRASPAVLINDLGDPVQFLIAFAPSQSTLSPGNLRSSFVASPSNFSPAPPEGLIFYGIRWPFAIEGAGTLLLTGEFENVQGSISDETVPEPATFALLALGLASLGFARRRRLHG